MIIFLIPLVALFPSLLLSFVITTQLMLVQNR